MWAVGKASLHGLLAPYGEPAGSPSSSMRIVYADEAGTHAQKLKQRGAR